ncbi:MAG: ABC transporter permease [bacterium]
MGTLHLLRKILFLKEIGGFVMLGAAVLVFYMISPPFLSMANVQIILQIAPELGILVTGVTLLMISGEFDLSVGSVFALSPIINIMLISSGWNVYLSAIFALIASCGIGALNAAMTLKLRIPSFITTLGTMMIWRGVVLLITGGWPFPFLEKAISVKRLLVGEAGSIRLSLIWYGIIVLVFWVILERSRFGNWMFAVGGNPSGARSLGVNPDIVKAVNFVIASFLAGLSGLIQAYRLEAFLPSAGVGLELDAIAGSVIGGASLAGGVGTVIGSVTGSFLIRIIDNGLVLAGAPGYWFRVFVGIVLVVALTLNRVIEAKVHKMR